jgi:hypothetical protein
MKEFLLGEAKWFGSGPLPAHLPYEVDAPEDWKGWRRQRLEPSLVGLLFPAAWSAFLLAAGGIPLLLALMGSGIGMEPRLGIGLVLASFGLLWMGASRCAARQIEGAPLRMLAWNLTRIETALLVVIAWTIDRDPTGPPAALALLITLPLWLSQLVRIATLFAWPAGRWLLPVAHVDVGLASIDERWVTESRRWARRPLARRAIPSGETGGAALELVLFGLRHGSVDFIAVHLVHPSGALLDPFVAPTVGDTVPFPRLGPSFADVPNVSSIMEFIDGPPVSPVVADWPASMLPDQRFEEE